MCGRISQYREPQRYAAHLGLANPFMQFDAADRRPGYNLAPGTHPLAIYPDETLRATHWGYCPDWARARHLPQTINARAETAARTRYFRALWKTGRVLIPADGWFEWRASVPAEANGNDPAAAVALRQPYYVRLKRDEPMYLAALSSVRSTTPQTAGMGFVIVTAPADAGLIDVHDRRPLAFARDAARRWLDRSLPLAEIDQLAHEGGVSTGRFVWYKVSADLDRPLLDEPRLIDALD
ncbi:MAG TPA: SOS response-associated peptidase [Paraburkholderia sp.]|jgi:putative SOS response-associated peptidase YedK